MTDNEKLNWIKAQQQNIVREVEDLLKVSDIFEEPHSTIAVRIDYLFIKFFKLSEEAQKLETSGELK